MKEELESFPLPKRARLHSLPYAVRCVRSTFKSVPTSFPSRSQLEHGQHRGRIVFPSTRGWSAHSSSRQCLSLSRTRRLSKRSTVAPSISLVTGSPPRLVSSLCLEFDGLFLKKIEHDVHPPHLTLKSFFCGEEAQMGRSVFVLNVGDGLRFLLSTVCETREQFGTMLPRTSRGWCARRQKDGDGTDLA